MGWAPVLFLLAFSISAWADDPPKAVVIKEDGKPLQVKFGDGRIAAYQIDAREPLTFAAPFSISENTCTKGEAAGCLLKGGIKIERPAFVWEAHSDVNKIGEPVTYEFGPGFRFPLLNFVFLTAVNRLLGDKRAQVIGYDEIECKDYSWIPGGTVQSPPENLLITRWDAEAMRVNPETGLMENRVIGGAVNVTLSKNQAGHLFIPKVQYFTGGQPTLSQGDIVAWIIRDSEGDFCQISLKPNFAQVQNEVMKYLSTLKGGFKPYLWGSDDYSTKNFAEFFNFFLKEPDKGTPQ